MSGAVGVGVIGAGVISDTYLENLQSFPDVDVVIVGDLLVDRAEAQARKHGVRTWGTVDDVLANPDVEIVVNLTIPAAHIEVSMRAVAAGKHVWTEKPIGLDREGAAELLAAAAAAGLRIGSAPDTILGPGFQTAKRAIAAGVILARDLANTPPNEATPEWMADWMVPFAHTIDAAKKYVVSSTLDHVDWNAELVRGDLGPAVERIKQQSVNGVFLGGVTLPLAIAELGLIDEYEFVVHPRIAGHGPTLLAGLSKYVDLQLVSRREFGSGAVALRYVPK